MEKFYPWLFSSAKIWLLIYPQRTKKSLQLPVFDKDALDSVILYGRENSLFLELGWGVWIDTSSWCQK